MASQFYFKKSNTGAFKTLCLSGFKCAKTKSKNLLTTLALIFANSSYYPFQTQRSEKMIFKNSSIQQLYMNLHPDFTKHDSAPTLWSDCQSFLTVEQRHVIWLKKIFYQGRVTKASSPISSPGRKFDQGLKWIGCYDPSSPTTLNMSRLKINGRSGLFPVARMPASQRPPASCSHKTGYGLGSNLQKVQQKERGWNPRQ